MFKFSNNIEDDFSAESKCGRKANIVGSGARKFGQSKKRHPFSPYSTKHVRGQLAKSEKSRAAALERHVRKVGSESKYSKFRNACYLLIYDLNLTTRDTNIGRKRSRGVMVKR